jgi:hypothetical protein
MEKKDINTPIIFKSNNHKVHQIRENGKKVHLLGDHCQSNLNIRVRPIEKNNINSCVSSMNRKINCRIR